MSVNVFGDKYVVGKDTEFLMKEKSFLSLTDDSFKVKNDNDETVFEVDAKVFTIRSTRKLKDAESGEVIWTMKKRRLSLRKNKFVLFKGDGDDDKVCTFEPDIVGNSVEIEWAIDDMPNVEIDGNIIGLTYDLEIKKLGRNPKLAEVRKKFRLLRGMDGDDPQAYAIEVKEGNDAAFVFACVMAMDEARNDDEGSD